MIKEAQKILEEILKAMGFEDFSINYSSEKNRFSVFIFDALFLNKNSLLLKFIDDLNFIFKSILIQKEMDYIHIDINNYRKEREEIIIKLAKAAAKKSATTKQKVDLPAMNAYERRIVHNELSTNPDVSTHSEGEGKHRHVVIVPIDMENNEQ